MMDRGQNRTSLRSLSLWLGLLLPPIAWALQMQINYVLVSFECYGGSKRPIYVVTLIAFVIATGSGLLGWQSWRKRSSPEGEGSVDVISRVRFMVLLGIMGSGMFSLVILAQGIATFVFHPCFL